MGYRSQYSGPQIDEALTKALEIAESPNAWIKVDSTIVKPVSLNDLTTSGNYTIAYWTDGPAVDAGFEGPLNVTVCSINGESYQLVDYLSVTFKRKLNEDGTFTVWETDETDSYIHITGSEPLNPADGTLWVDTYDPQLPILKIYVKSFGWIECAPTTMMRKSVYDPLNQQKDIYTHVDETVAAASENLQGVSTDFQGHVEDSSIHVTQDQVNDWNSRATQETVDTSISTLRNELMNNVVEQSKDFATDTNTLTDIVQDYVNTLDSHIGNSTIHTTATQHNSWNSKAEADHTHLNDGRVTIDASKISGMIPIERIDPSVLERIEIVSTDANRLALTTDVVQNGDQVYVEETLMFYFVVDDTKLGTDDAASAFKDFGVGAALLNWNNIVDKPTTIEGFGIIDAYNRNEIDEMASEISTIVEEANTLSTEYEAVANISVEEYTADMEVVTNTDIPELKGHTENILNFQSNFDECLTALSAAVDKTTALI